MDQTGKNTYTMGEGWLQAYMYLRWGRGSKFGDIGEYVPNE